MEEIKKFAEEVAAQIKDYLPSTFNTGKGESCAHSFRFLRMLKVHPLRH